MKKPIFVVIFQIFLWQICLLPAINGKDPDDDIPTCQLVTSKGYPCLEYNVTTSDGYILTIHSTSGCGDLILSVIPYGLLAPGNVQSTGKPVVYLQHGLLDSSATWVMNFPNESLGFLMADAGYDVWLGNMRGNTYAMANTKYTTKNDEFWHFSFDEMAKYDVPAITEFALASTGKSYVYYVGHSQGTIVGFIQFSQDPTWAKSKIKQFHALAPVAFLYHTTSPLKLISPFANEIGFLLELLGIDEFLPNSKFIDWLAGALCNPPMEFLCDDVLMVIAGYDTANMNQSRNSVYLTHTPAGTSTYNMVHFAQLMATNKFQMMDWGYIDNEKYYGQHSPPQYNPNAITAPTALYYGDTDEFADPKDVQYLQTLLQPQTILGVYEYKVMDHMDFVWGMNAPVEVYPTLMQHIADDVAASKQISRKFK